MDDGEKTLVIVVAIGLPLLAIVLYIMPDFKFVKRRDETTTLLLPPRAHAMSVSPPSHHPDPTPALLNPCIWQTPAPAR